MWWICDGFLLISCLESWYCVVEVEMKTLTMLLHACSYLCVHFICCRSCWGRGGGKKGFLFFGCVNVCVFVKMKKSTNKLWGKKKEMTNKKLTLHLHIVALWKCSFWIDLWIVDLFKFWNFVFSRLYLCGSISIALHLLSLDNMFISIYNHRAPPPPPPPAPAGFISGQPVSLEEHTQCVLFGHFSAVHDPSPETTTKRQKTNWPSSGTRSDDQQAKFWLVDRGEKTKPKKKNKGYAGPTHSESTMC